MLDGIELEFTVPSPVGAGEVKLAASYYPTTVESGSQVVLVCLPGGSYTRKYWHSEALAPLGYSFAEYMTSRGYGVLSIDTLGTGESTRPDNGDDLSLETLAQASAALVGQLREGIPGSRTPPGLGDLTSATLIGVGHSLGGAILIAQQGLYASFDAVAVLGFTNLHLETMYVPHEREADLTPEERMEWAREHVPVKSWGMRWDELDMYFMIPREGLRSWFHWSDVPENIKEIEESEATVTPRAVALQSIIPRCTAKHASRITAPVFLAFGEQDVSPDPHAEVVTYPESRDVSLYVLANSGHCHNYAGTRELLWKRLDAWSHGRRPA